MVAILVLALVVLWLVLPIITLVKVSGIASEMWELKMLVKRLANSDAKPKDKPEAEVKPEIVAKPEAEAQPKIVAKPKVPAPAPLVPPHVPVAKTPSQRRQPAPEPEPTAFDIFWSRIEDWLAVRGAFAPVGMTREFAVATRWLVRIGTLILVGAIAYFMVLAIDKGWIGPAQRVYGMMFWGVFGIVAGTWIKFRKENYAILGEVAAALGLVALYLSFGLGHRYFKPPVIESGYFAFAGLFAVTITAGALSVRLKSLMIAGLALVGGFLVPTICSFADHDVQLHIYLFLLSLGAYAVACLRGWPLYSFATIALSLMFSQAKCGSCDNCDATVAYMFHALGFTLTLATAIRTSVRMENARRRPLYWIPVALAGIFCLCKMEVIVSHHFAWRGAWALNHLGWAMVFAALAFFSRRRAWGGTPVFIVLSCVCAALALGTASLEWWHVNDATAILLFCLFAALLAELGARSEERTLQVLAVMATVVMSFVGFGRFTASVGIGSGGYAHDLVDRIQYLWPVPAVVAFVGWRLGGRALWAGWLRNWSLGIAAVMSFVVVTGESHFFRREFLPMLRGGFVTIVSAAVASALLAAGIVRRVKVARLMGLGILALSVAKLMLVDTSSLATPGRVGVFAAVGALLIAGAFLYLKFRNRFEEAGAEARHPDQIAGAEARRPSTEAR